jgi:CheY-like chemotaxis protein/DNA-binding XRE family transcriptional regulator
VPKLRRNGRTALSSFAAAIRKRRAQLGITQEELAWRAGLHRTYVTDIERGARNLSLQSIEKLARALQAPIAELFAVPAGGQDAAGQTPVDILLVEDNPDDVELTLKAFQSARLKNRVHIVRDGAEAVNFLFGRGPFTKVWHPHQALVVLLDLNLPKLSGLEVLRRIRGDARTITLPVVVLTVSDHGRDIAECRRLGCNHYIVKPVGFENFSRITPNLNLDWALTRQPGLEEAEPRQIRT